jgi:histidinol-phosphatase (PHP family)
MITVLLFGCIRCRCSSIYSRTLLHDIAFPGMLCYNGPTSVKKKAAYMLYKQNLHTHTTYVDGKDTPEEMVLTAIEKGFSSIGFSEHSYMAFSDYPYQMTVEKTEDYNKEVRSLADKYRGEIGVFCGLEFEFFSDLATDGFDYLIGSVHYLDFDGKILGFDRNLELTLEYLRDNFGGDGMAFAKRYYETVARLPEKRNFDIIGHFDLLTKNNEAGRFIDTESKKYIDLGIEAIHSLRGKIPIFEVNTGAIARGYRTLPYPQIEFLREFKNCGFGAVISSDCHDKKYLDCYYEEAEELLRAAGFKLKWIPTKDGFTEVGI